MTLDEKRGGFTLIDWFDMNHPILRNVSGRGEFQKPEVRSYVTLVPGSAMSVIARFNDGSMAIGESPCGKGRAVVFGVDATAAGSDLPLTGLFVPLFIRTVQYLSGTFVTGTSYRCGQPVSEVIGTNNESSSVFIKPDDGPAQRV